MSSFDFGEPWQPGDRDPEPGDDKWESSLPEPVSSVDGDRSGLEPIGICHICANRTRPFPPQCKAFPDGIPTEILVGDFVHTQPYPNDRGIRFEDARGLTVAVDPGVQPQE